MTSTVKITVFFVLAMTISCYGQITNGTNATAQEIDPCANFTSCGDCTNSSGCVFKLKNCSASHENATDADYFCVHHAHQNATSDEGLNCTINATDECKANGTEPGPAAKTTTLSPDLPVVAADNDGTTSVGPPQSTDSDTGTTAPPSTAEGTTPEAPTTSESTGSPTDVAPNTTTPEVTTPSTPEEITTTVPTATTTNVSSSTVPEEHTSTEGHPSTSDHTSPPAKTSRHFDAPSFIGGIILSVGLLAIAFVGYKFYRARTEHNYHTL